MVNGSASFCSYDVIIVDTNIASILGVSGVIVVCVTVGLGLNPPLELQ